MQIISEYLIYLLFMTTNLLLYSKLYYKVEGKLDIKKHIIFIVIASLPKIFVCIYDANFFPLIWGPISLIIGIKYLYNRFDFKTIVIVVVIQLLNAISELIFSLIGFHFLGFTYEYMMKDEIGIIITNSAVYIIFLALAMIKKVNINISTAQEYIKQGKKQTIYVIVVTIFIIVVTYFNFIYINATSGFLMLQIIFLISFFYLIGYHKERIQNKKLSEEYSNLFDYLKTFEKVFEEKSIQYHEYNNQLLLIKEMSNQKTKKYIEKIVKDVNITEEEKLYRNLSKILSKEIRGFIYYKLLKAKEENINVDIYMSNDLLDDNLWRYDQDKLLNIIKVLGVTLDNAIESSKITKEKNLMIQIYIEEERIIFEITNSFDCDEIKKVLGGIKSTKNPYRGHGLKVINQITSQTNIEVETQIIKNLYTKKIKI